MPSIYLVSTHGRQRLVPRDDERMFDLLARYAIAWSSVSIYTRSGTDQRPLLCACLDRQLDGFDDVDEVFIYFNRNVNPMMFSLSDFKRVAAEGDEEATEYIYQHLDNARSSTSAYLKKLSPEECRQTIAARVAETMRTTVPAGADLVVGVSGGGDSNALLYALARLSELDIHVHPVIIMGIPDWDLGVPRAAALCAEYGLNLTIVAQKDVKALLGMPDDGVALIDRFEREFEGDDFEFLGTLLVRLALAKRARELGTRYICTGVNLEDVLCEAMFRVSSGLQPAPFPARVIGDMTLVFPLWLCPKRIIDGCFPRLSLDNYDSRYPCYSLGRNLYYSLVFAMQSQFPGYVEQLAHGFSELGQQHPAVYTFDETLGFHVERFVPFPLQEKFRRMLAGAGAPLAPAQAR